MAPVPHAIRLSDEDSVYQRSNNPLLGYELKKNFHGPDANLFTSLSGINSDGQRDVRRVIQRTPGTRRIILLGDSVVAGHGLRRLDDTISRQLEEQFTPGSVEVLNFGVGGYCTRAEVELLRTKGLKYRADLVVLLFLGNDYEDLNTQVHKYQTRFKRPRWVKGLFLNSALFRLTAIRANWYHFGDDANPLAWNRKAIGQDNVATGLAMLRDLADEHGFDAVVALWPGFADDFMVEMWQEPTTPDSMRVKRIAEEHGLPIITLLDSFEDDFREHPRGSNPRELYTIGDTLHPSPLGSRIASQALAARLRSRFDYLPE